MFTLNQKVAILVALEDHEETCRNWIGRAMNQRNVEFWQERLRRDQSARDAVMAQPTLLEEEEEVQDGRVRS